MQHFDEHAIKDLEFDTIREWVENGCVQPTARRMAASMAPISNHANLLTELARVNQFVQIRRGGVSFPAIDFEEIEDEVKLLQLRDSMLLEESFKRIFRVCELINEMITAFEGMKEALPDLWSLLDQLGIQKEIPDAILAVFDSKWQIADHASPELSHIRQQIASVRRQITRNFQKVLKEYQGKGFLGDTGEAYINERRVLAIYTTHKRKVSGIVTGSSKTGALTYIEPEINIQLSFELEALFDDERREVRRILQQLTNAIRGHLPYLRSAQKSLTIFDFIQAKSRVALDLDANLPTISDEPLIDLVDAFHPILFRNNRAKGKKTLPQTLKIDTQHRILVISGPNAGGKSITMKTIGLLQAMFQSGMLVPVHERSQMSILSGILTDIGDNQSIENQLSTYSYRLRRMKHFLEAANRRSLVLLDEFGTGSDPDLGGALAEVFFEALYRKKSFGVITTHYANIKLKAAELPHAINGCMLFDTASLLPLYQLSLGQPGSSFTFEVAEMNGIPKELIADAKKKLSRQKVKMDELLSSLQEEKNRYSKMSKDAEQAASVAGAAIEDFERMKLRFETKLQKQQESIEKNNKFMVLGKKMDGFIAAWNPRKKNADVLEEVKKFIVVEKNKIEDHRKEEAIKRQVSKEKKIQEQADYQLEKIQPGSLVKLEKTRQTGTVMSIENQEAIVAFGHFKTRVDLKKLIFIQ